MKDINKMLLMAAKHSAERLGNKEAVEIAIKALNELEFDKMQASIKITLDDLKLSTPYEADDEIKYKVINRKGNYVIQIKMKEDNKWSDFKVFKDIKDAFKSLLTYLEPTKQLRPIGENLNMSSKLKEGKYINSKDMDRILNIVIEIDPDIDDDIDSDDIYHEDAYLIKLDGDGRVWDEDLWDPSYKDVFEKVKKAIEDEADRVWGKKDLNESREWTEEEKKDNDLFVKIFRRLRSTRGTPLTKEMEDLLDKYGLKLHKYVGTGGNLKLPDQREYTNYSHYQELGSTGTVEGDAKINWVDKINKLRERNPRNLYLAWYGIDYGSDDDEIKPAYRDKRHIITSASGDLSFNKAFSYDANARRADLESSSAKMNEIKRLVNNKNWALKQLSDPHAPTYVKKRALPYIEYYNKAIDQGFIRDQKKIKVDFDAMKVIEESLNEDYPYSVVNDLIDQYSIYYHPVEREKIKTEIINLTGNADVAEEVVDELDINYDRIINESTDSEVSNQIKKLTTKANKLEKKVKEDRDTVAEAELRNVRAEIEELRSKKKELKESLDTTIWVHSVKEDKWYPWSNVDREDFDLEIFKDALLSKHGDKYDDVKVEHNKGKETLDEELNASDYSNHLNTGLNPNREPYKSYGMKTIGDAINMIRDWGHKAGLHYVYSIFTYDDEESGRSGGLVDSASDIDEAIDMAEKFIEKNNRPVYVEFIVSDRDYEIMDSKIVWESKDELKESLDENYSKKDQETVAERIKDDFKNKLQDVGVRRTDCEFEISEYIDNSNYFWDQLNSKLEDENIGFSIEESSRFTDGETGEPYIYNYCYIWDKKKFDESLKEATEEDITKAKSRLDSLLKKAPVKKPTKKEISEKINIIIKHWVERLKESNSEPTDSELEIERKFNTEVFWRELRETARNKNVRVEIEEKHTEDDFVYYYLILKKYFKDEPLKESIHNKNGYTIFNDVTYRWKDDTNSDFEYHDFTSSLSDYLRDKVADEDLQYFKIVPNMIEGKVGSDIDLQIEYQSPEILLGSNEYPFGDVYTGSVLDYVEDEDRKYFDSINKAMKEELKKVEELLPQIAKDWGFRKRK